MARGVGLLHEALAMQALGYMEALEAADFGPVGGINVRSYEHAMGIADFFRIKADWIVDCCAEHGDNISVEWLMCLSPLPRFRDQNFPGVNKSASEVERPQ